MKDHTKRLFALIDVVMQSQDIVVSALENEFNISTVRGSQGMGAIFDLLKESARVEQSAHVCSYQLRFDGSEVGLYFVLSWSTAMSYLRTQEKYATDEEMLSAGNALSARAAERLWEFHRSRSERVWFCPAGDDELVEAGFAEIEKEAGYDVLVVSKEGKAVSEMIWG